MEDKNKKPDLKKAITENDLKERFKKQIATVGKLNTNVRQLQNNLQQIQAAAAKAEGAAEGTINMLAEIIGDKAAQEFGQGIINPQPENNKKEIKEDKV